MADISKINAVLIANIAEIDDVLAANIAKVNGLVFSTAPAFTGLLDTYTGAAAAYSTRRLYSLYTGAALRVREDSGDTETDIGFDSNGDLDTAAIATHCGSANGYVTKWYGQESSGGTGSGNDAAQTTSGSQPQIYDGSAVITENGQPALDTTAGSCGFSISFASAAANTYSVFHVSRINDSDNLWVMLAGNSGNQLLPRAQNNTNTNVAPGWTMSNWYKDGSSVSITTRNDVLTTYGNTQFLANYYGSPGADATQDVLLNRTATDASYDTVGFHQEYVIWPSDQSSNRAGIEGNLNAHYQIGNFGTPTSGLLATYTGAAAAYSVRQLSNTSFLAMRIREDGTDTETDIGFDANGNLDTAAIASHCGSNNGYVVTWYDQSGNQNDAAQGTSGSQPQIYNGTAVITENGKAAIQFDGTLDSLDYDLDTSLSAASYYHTFTVYQSSTTNSIYHGSRDTFAAYHFGLDGSTSTNLQGPMLSNKTTFNHFYKNGSQSFTSSTTRDQYFTEYFTGDQTLMAYMMTVDGGSSNTTQWHIGRNKETLYGVDGNIQEFIVYQTDQSSNQSGIETDINNYFSIY